MTHQCLCSSPLANTLPLRRHRMIWKRENSSLHIWTTFRWQFLGLTELAQCTHLFKNICNRVPGSTSTGKTQVWNSAGVRPAACNVLERMAQVADPEARVWRGSGETDLPPAQQGITVLGTPLGHPSFVQGHLEKKAAEQRTLMERIPLVRDLQSAWLLLLHCATARANYLLQCTTTERGIVCATFCT